MREFKFRAWDKEGKRMYSLGHLADIAYTTEFGHGWGRDLQRYEIMQYTGLKDKNGKEIYEGDILGQRPYGYYKSDGTKDGRYKGKDWQCFAVEWGEWADEDLGLASGYEYETDGKVAGWNITFGHEHGSDDELKHNEVIGNIYENPELLDRQ